MCGLITKSKYPDFNSLIEPFDLFCITETKCDKYDIISSKNHIFLSKPRTQKFIRKSGGIGLLVKQNISKYVETIDSDCEYIMWIKLNKAIFNIDNDIIMGIIYIPPDQSKFYNEDEMQILNDEIINMCSTTKSLILTGDCNGHTAELPDFISLDNFLADYFDLDNDTISYIDQTQTLTDNKIPLNRKSQDTKVNSTGRKLIDICKNNNLFIINGRLGQDRGIGKCTFRNKSLIDYTICSPNA